MHEIFGSTFTQAIEKAEKSDDVLVHSADEEHDILGEEQLRSVKGFGTISPQSKPEKSRADFSQKQIWAGGETNGRERESRESSSTTSAATGNTPQSSVSTARPALQQQGVEVSADNIWEAFLSTRPSLSPDDRARYDSAYQKFRGGSRQADFNPVSSVDDGSLRTALK